MTVRIVGTMSLVLLLSLGAFAALMHRHHGMVMDELAQTVASVGRETLRTFQIALPREAGPDAASLLDAGALPPGEHTVEHKVIMTRGKEAQTEVHRVVVVDGRAAAPGAAGEPVRIDGAPGADGATATFAFTSDGVREQCVVERPAGAKASGEPMICALDLEDVRVERDAKAGLLLRIPHEPGHEPGKDPKLRAMAYSATWHQGDRDIVLPVPTGEYQALMTSTWRKTLAAFGGVFVVAVVLSASLAARLTRPIRRLDAAIHRLSAGDLDVEVDAGGKDEVGRLARGFNEMAAHLRAAKERERELTRRERLSALGRLAAGVAHDVRNPLHAIGLTLQNLKEAGRPEDPLRAAEHDRSVRIIHEEIKRLNALVESFLRFAKSDRSTREPVDVAAMLASIEELLDGEARRRGIEIARSVASPLPPLLGNAESLRSSLLNLVLNAFEATSDGGRVELSAWGAGGAVAIRVADTGCGIPPEDQERIFDFAYTTREGGSGLGLAMVHHVVAVEHGGRVHLESAPGSGTRVTLELPAATEAAHAA